MDDIVDPVVGVKGKNMEIALVDTNPCGTETVTVDPQAWEQTYDLKDPNDANAASFADLIIKDIFTWTSTIEPQCVV